MNRRGFLATLGVIPALPLLGRAGARQAPMRIGANTTLTTKTGPEWIAIHVDGATKYIRCY